MKNNKYANKYPGIRTSSRTLLCLGILLLCSIGYQASAYTITGTIFNAPNGLPLLTTTGVHGTPTGSIDNLPLYVYLVNNNDSIIRRSQVATDGTYRIDSVIAGMAGAVQMSMNYYPIYGKVYYIGLPSNYIPVGEGDDTLGDPVADYSFPLAQTNDIIVNFAFDQRPTSNNSVISNYTYADRHTLIVPASAFNGTDPEDGLYQNDLAGRTIDLYPPVPAQSTTLYYFDTLIDFTSASNVTINNFDPTRVTLHFTGIPVTRGFSYNLADNAGARAYVPSMITTSVPLFISLVSFTGSWLSEAPKLSWTTASEKNNSYFVIERSSNGADFTSIDKVMSKATNGNSDQGFNYTYTDNMLSKQHLTAAYYRLRAVDKSGMSTVSRVIHLSSGTSGLASAATLNVYPNPATDRIWISIANVQQGVAFNLQSSMGAIIYHQKISSSEGQTSLDVSKLPAGQYYLQAITDNGSVTNQSIVITH